MRMANLTVTVPASERDLATLAAVRSELGIIGTDQDADISVRLRQASAAIESFCDRVFARETVQEVFRLECSAAQIALRRTPVVELASIVEDGAELDPADYEADLDRGIIYRLCSDRPQPWGGGKLVVTYTAGYLLPGVDGANLPADITMACLQAVVAGYQAKGRDPMLRSESIDGTAAYSYLDPRDGNAGLPPQVASLLMPYRAIYV